MLQKILRYKMWLIVLVIVLVSGKFGMDFYQTQNKPATAIRLATVEKGDIFAIVSATGTIEPVNSVDVSSKVTGLIKEVRVNENDLVIAGQVLVILDATRLSAQVAQAEAKLANATANFERMKQLNTIGAIAKQQLDAARMEYNVAQASHTEAASQLADTTILAPITGTVIGKPIPAGQTVSPGISTPMVLLTIADMSKMQIEAQIDESDIGKILVGQKVSFTVDTYPDKSFSGEVASVSHKAKIQQNVVYYPVIIDVDSAQGLLKPTMTARVSVNAGESKNALIVPLQAVKEAKGQRYVQVLKNGQPQNVTVTTGLASDDKIEIVKGIKEGDQIILPQSKQQGQQQGGPNPMRMMSR
ncbi:efflux transporter periplasmic adaptor subunit [Anaerosporomusa subterranea]|uniref:Efflux transporter periplasmic adaptor subunit n=1 Tax=Anaerosporomusa subterranea TaxID=1794912 RepID=A0A154BN87_ANASB|nr:efflux RND transporter periplasmic adaptor subunit [Anaerosporomusa subterranea]KYZ75382.1 efflux transporter periplasmic adaptor subunit [Anaerosporomusa subterranea]